MYFYDKEFRMHISKFCQCNWAIILQQAWSMCLKDKVRQFGDDNRPAKNVKKGGEPCCRFNKGKCTYGSSCKFDHRCSVKKCSKFGHRAHICRMMFLCHGFVMVHHGSSWIIMVRDVSLSWFRHGSSWFVMFHCQRFH